MARRPGAWLVAGVLVAGCAVYTSSIAPDAPLHATSAYLYGRFVMNASSDEEPAAGPKQSVGLVVHCLNGYSSFTFGSRDSRDLQVLEIKPSRCWLMGAEFVDQAHIIHKQVKVDPWMQRPLDFTAGRAHYIGDYFARGDFSSQSLGLVTEFRWEWVWSSGAVDSYAATTAEMKRAFPNLAELPTDDQRLIPEAPRKRTNGVGAAPGEPPLSPERVARLAPFIRRSYASPAQCEAACPAGQCLPYRGESGTAMACVIHCDRNADCPAGLACNCPNGESPAGPDCHPIAATATDPMARICLTP